MGRDLPDKKGVLVDTYGSADFSRDVIRKFPMLQAELQEDVGLLHMQMGTLSKIVLQAITSGELVFPLQICEFLDSVLSRECVHPEIENSLAISFIEASALRQSKIGRQLLKKMPSRVEKILIDQERRGG